MIHQQLARVPTTTITIIIITISMARRSNRRVCEII